MSWRETVAALLGISAFAAEPSKSPSLGDKSVEKRLKAIGGQLSPLPSTRLRWFLADLETAQHAADGGDLTLAAQLISAAMGDGFLRGVMSARMVGVSKLPKKFYGDPEQIEALTTRDGVRSVFDDMFPASELAALGVDGLTLGVGVAQLVPVPGRSFPVLVRLEPEFLRYRWTENRWYYASTAGLLPITPGDGKWILHLEGGRVSPWRTGLWRAIGSAWIDKTHARLHEANWEAKLANPARVAYAALGATEGQRKGMLARLMAWGINNVFELPPGWEVKILESNGNGHDSFEVTIERSNIDFMVSILGQVGTTTSAGAFASSDVHESVRADLIGVTADALAHTLNTQGIPPWVVSQWGEAGLVRAAVFEFDKMSPKALVARASGLTALGAGVAAANAALLSEGKRVDASEEYRRFGVAIVDINAAPGDVKALPGASGSPAASSELETAPEPEPAPAVALAEAMTDHGVDRCEHGATNRCRLCGVERARGLDVGEDGAHSWRLAWQPIAKDAA